ncbi:hypothetical protein O988_04911 [Pseudogymnoascus sp. VKM F-3808]|nr:hypothetical protein O988_04911 [Pseudogymnoascus sp. VKM F-3808]
MNSIRQVQELNRRELENGVSPEASWHSDYKDTAYIYIGGLPFQLSEGDIITIFSQYGEPTFINLVRDKETGESKGFAFLKYEDQRSTDLAVDNLGGTKIMNRVLRVDHTRYKKQDEEPDKGLALDVEGIRSDPAGLNNHREAERLMSKEERELMALEDEHDEEDPMKEYLTRSPDRGTGERGTTTAVAALPDHVALEKGLTVPAMIALGKGHVTTATGLDAKTKKSGIHTGRRTGYELFHD